jgi:hypothetical protein
MGAGMTPEQEIKRNWGAMTPKNKEQSEMGAGMTPEKK